MEILAAARISILGICLNWVNSSHNPLACHVLRIFDVFDIFASHNIVYCIIAYANLNYYLSIVTFEEPLTAYYAIWQTIVAHLATQVQTRSQCKGVQAQILNPESYVASQAYLYLWPRP